MGIIDRIREWLAGWGLASGATYDIAVLVVLLGAAIGVHLTLGRALRAVLRRIVERTPGPWDNVLLEARVFAHLMRLLPIAIVWAGADATPGLSATAVTVVERVAGTGTVLVVAMALHALLGAALRLYQLRPEAKTRSIKGYIQVTRIVVWLCAFVVGVAAAADKSPLLFLSGLGALGAVLLLVFRDTILSFVASVQIATNDMIRVGDWVEVPSAGADGDVIDIALHVVKVKNWDNTITTIPTYSLISEGFKNWRSMVEGGARRIKRAVIIEHASIRHLQDDEVDELRGVRLLHDYVVDKQRAVKESNDAVPGEHKRVATNLRRLTNIGSYRAYLIAYLKAHPRVRQDVACMVRQLAPTPQGLPIELYCFTHTTVWAEYEGIQADLFDHAIAVAAEFGLRVYQAPSSDDVRAVRTAAAAAAAAAITADAL